MKIDGGNDLKLSWHKWILCSICYGKWDIGFHTRRTWPNKPYIYALAGYYDGFYWGLHLGWLFVGCEF